MKVPATLLLSALTLSAASYSQTAPPLQSTGASPERLGTVSFPVSCAASTQTAFNRGVALLHDFWYDEAQRQFEQIAAADPQCAMAHWGVAMSHFHQIWARPGESATIASRAEMEKAQQLPAKTAREQAYIAALSAFFVSGKQDFPVRIAAYSADMGKLYTAYPDDVDAGAFYALSSLAAENPDDTSLLAEHKAMAVLTPLWTKAPDNPGVVHYIIHACDNPSMAADGLAAANHYGEIAPSGAHAFHMPGHIYARLGMWPQDIQANLGSVAASEAAEASNKSGLMDEPHAYDFLLYAYLQSGRDAEARGVLDQTTKLLAHLASMPEMKGHREGMVPYYQTELPAFYSLEMRDWKTAATLEPAPHSPPEVAPVAYWARAVASGHLRQPLEAKADLARYDGLMIEIKKGKEAYLANSTGSQIVREEILGWVAYASSKDAEAVEHMRSAADLQDKVGQGEVDIPAREMLADILFDSGHPEEALAEYEIALQHSPNRFNGLFNAGRAAEAAGNKQKAQSFYTALLKSTDDGKQSTRPEFAHVREFTSSPQLAAK